MEAELIKKYEAEIAEAKAQADEALKAKDEAEVKAKEAEEAKAVLEAEKVKTDEARAKEVKENELKEIKTFAQKLVDDKKILPTELNRVVRILEAADNSEKKEFELADGKKEKLSLREDIMKEYSSRQELGLFKEFAGSGSSKVGEDKLTVLAKEYADKNKVSLGEAYAKVSSESPELREKDPVALAGK